MLKLIHTFHAQPQTPLLRGDLELRNRDEARRIGLGFAAGEIVRWGKGRWQPISRGGSWERGGRFCRSASRGYHAPDNRHNYCGFRVILVVELALRLLIAKN